MEGSTLLHGDLTKAILGAAIEVHRALGPGLLESPYRRCLARELECRGVQVLSEVVLDLDYKGIVVPNAYRLDLLVADAVVVEVKAVERFEPVHRAQLLTYLRLSKKRVGLLLNFNVRTLMPNGLIRVVL